MTAIDYEAIYRHSAVAYDRMVDAEDCDGNLLPALESVAPLAGRTVVEVGAGTGRITRQLMARGCRVFACEPAPAMIEVARRRLGATGGARSWCLARADGLRLPVASGCADLAIAGWVFGHFCRWEPSGWRDSVGVGLAEMRRAVRPGGSLIVIETLGTGCRRPAVSDPDLAELQAWLEAEQGFTRSEIRTDYAFPDVRAAAEATGFFFGREFAERVRSERWARIPECTGVWHRSLAREQRAPGRGAG